MRIRIRLSELGAVGPGGGFVDNIVFIASGLIDMLCVETKIRVVAGYDYLTLDAVGAM